MHFYRDASLGFHTMKLDDYSSRSAAVIIRDGEARGRAAEHAQRDGWHLNTFPGYPVMLITTIVLALPAFASYPCRPAGRGVKVS